MTEVLALLAGFWPILLIAAIIIAPGFVSTYWEFARGLRKRRKGHLLPIVAALAAFGPR